MRTSFVIGLVFSVALALAVAAVASEGRSTVAVLFNLPKNWAHTGEKATGKEELHFVVALKNRNLDQLEALYWDRSNPESPNWRLWMSKEEISALVNPTKADHDAVVSWLSSQGVESIESYGDALHCKAYVSVLSSAFEADFVLFKHSKTGSLLARAYGSVSVPAELAGKVTMIEGLTHFPIERTLRQRKGSKNLLEKRQFDPLDWDGYIVPQSVWNQYQIPWNSKVSGSNVTQGVVEWEQQYFSPQDLTAFGKKFGVQVSQPNVVGSGSGAGSPEGSLDIQWIQAIASGAKNTYWMNDGANTWLFGWSSKFFAATQVPYVNSISYAWSESDQCQQGIGYQECQKLNVTSFGYVAAVNVQFQKIGLRGVTLTVASGDSGANGRTDESCSNPQFFPDFPSCSPYVTSVGATEIRDVVYMVESRPPGCSIEERFCVSYGEMENAVSYSFSNFASGGGFSNAAPTPAWQMSAVQKYLGSSQGKAAPKGFYNASGRGYPDIAAVGESWIMIVDGGSSTPIGGTSASSPIIAGVFTLLNDYSLTKSGKSLGPMNQFLYQMAAKKPSAFTDITYGDNHCTEQGCGKKCQGFQAAPGWDPVTGLGTPVYPQMLAYLQTILKS